VRRSTRWCLPPASLQENPNILLPDWSRAHGFSLLSGEIRRDPGDFRVIEHLGFEPSGDGEHDFLYLEKVAANTPWLARALAQHAGVPDRDVGYCGLKDRHAVTRQWFSVRRLKGGTDWTTLSLPGIEILKHSRNDRKLRRGAHAFNDFELIIRNVSDTSSQLADLLGRIATAGVPNYFGVQRFGRNASNLRTARSMFAGERRRRTRMQRSLALSAARSFVFNEILGYRVRAGNWCKAVTGDVFNLDGSNSVFDADIDDAINARLETLDIHPTGAMWGTGSLRSTHEAADIESGQARAHQDLCEGLEQSGLQQSRRALRLAVQDLHFDIAQSDLHISFRLRAGGYATAVLREILKTGAGIA